MVKIYQFKGKVSEIKLYPLCLGNIGKYDKWFYECFVPNDTIDVSEIADIYQCLMKKNMIHITVRIYPETFFFALLFFRGALAGIAQVSDCKKYVQTINHELLNLLLFI